MGWLQKEVRLEPRRRGFHLVTREIVEQLPELSDYRVGVLHVFIQHTSASLTLNENADPDVRRDMETAINRICPENWPYVHTVEGPDDMPAHVKASLMGHSISIPILDGQLQTGTWQGVYLGEHRDRGGSRRLICTVMGEQNSSPDTAS